MKKISDYKFEIEKKDEMNVPGLIYAKKVKQKNLLYIL